MHANYSGVGNTFNANHPVPQKLIVDCLRFWVEEAHVDGFRFDEGSILARGEDGTPLPHPPVIWQIELDDALADTKVIAEAWDAAGLYQVGHFPGDRWGEWNGQYRDDIRRFLKGDPGLVGVVASRLGGSADIYQARGQTPGNSINFVTVHDGFTLNDLVSYNDKHNDANGEGNQDGINNNYSWNCGVEGPTADAEVNRLRLRQIKNALTILMLSRGVPMMLGGDEFRRTQGEQQRVQPGQRAQLVRLGARRDQSGSPPVTFGASSPFAARIRRSGSRTSTRARPTIAAWRTSPGTERRCTDRAWTIRSADPWPARSPASGTVRTCT